MNAGENTFDLDTIVRFNKYLDQIEASEGPAVLITIGTGSKNFSLGFDMMQWAKGNGISNLMISLAQQQQLLARFLTLPMPTMAVLNGHTYAGGLILALCHDFRIMAEGRRKICLSELRVGFPLPPAYNAFCAATLPI